MIIQKIKKNLEFTRLVKTTDRPDASPFLGPSILSCFSYRFFKVKVVQPISLSCVRKWRIIFHKI